jgi:hypothetical protein
MASYADVIKTRKRSPKWPRTLTMWGLDSVSDAQWRATMDDGRRFVAAGWPHQAAALGWTEENAVGLIWSLRGRRVIAMTARRAAIMSAGGAVTFYRRMASSPVKKRLRAP